MAETNLRRGLMLSDGNFVGFLTNPISGAFLLLAVLSVAWHVVGSLRARKNASTELAQA